MEAWVLPESRSKGGLSLPLYPWVPRCESSLIIQSGRRYQYRNGSWRILSDREKTVCLRRMRRIHIVGTRIPKQMLPSEVPVYCHLDRVPNENPDWNSIAAVAVPSKGLQERLRSLIPRGVSIQHVLPTVPEDFHRWETAGLVLRRVLRDRWGLHGKRVLGIVHGTVDPMEWAGCREVVAGLQDKRLKRLVLCVFSADTLRGEEAGRNWVAADWILTGGSSDISRTPLHFWAMARGMPLLTTNVGDHGEWVRHRYNGLLLNPDRWKQELAGYLTELFRHPNRCEEWGKNGRMLVRKWTVKP